MKVLDYGLIAVAEELQQIAFTALNGSEGNDNSQGVQLEDTCIATLDKHVKKVLNGIDKKEALQKSVAKNVTNCRHRIIKEFMRSHMVNKRRDCPGCKAPSRDVRSEYNSRVFLKALSAREANKWVKIRILHAYLKEHSASPANSTEDNLVKKLKVRWEQKITKTLLIMLMLFISCYLPACALIYIINLCNTCNCDLVLWSRDVQFLLILANSSMNPFVYSWRLNNCRRAFLWIVTCGKKGKKAKEYSFQMRTIRRAFTPNPVSGDAVAKVIKL